MDGHGSKEKAGVAVVLVSDKILQNKEGNQRQRQCVTIKGPAQQEDITVVNICALNIATKL